MPTSQHRPRCLGGSLTYAMLRRVVHRSRPISSQIFQNGVLAATSSARRAFSAAFDGLFGIAHLPIGSNPITIGVAMTP